MENIHKKIRIDRVWSMPSAWTFTIKPIGELLARYVPAGGKDWIDPFAGNNSPAEITNDHNPDRKATYHLEAMEFALQLPRNDYVGVLFDPPYSYRQVSEHYKAIGKKATQKDTSTQFFNRVLNPLADKLLLMEDITTTPFALLKQNYDHPPRPQAHRGGGVSAGDVISSLSLKY